MFHGSHYEEKLRDIFVKTLVMRKPLTGIVSDYHELPYVLVAPDERNAAHSVEVNGTIQVSPRFVITPDKLGETFKDVFDPETFDHEIQARVFSFAYSRRRNLKVENMKFQVRHVEENPQDHADRIQDDLLRQENIRTGLILGPRFRFYPVSLDRFISEIVDREFSV